MAENVDRRIMEMRFENRQFERNIAKSKKSVEELKEAMDFDETSKGMEKFAKGMEAIDFSKMESNIQKLTDKFTGLGKFSELVISQIRRGIEDVARKFSGFITSMTTQQVHAGMTKYNELNKSVQTIKAATGEDEKTVYQVLERLNKYTDQTSYNFADMAANIGKFTSVGIDLKSAEKQMEGIANWAARSGAGMAEASRAMYNLSQAMGVGKLTKIDWKSIENAGMATKEFKEQLIQAGVEMGTLVETIDKKSGQTVYKTSQKLGKQVEVNFSNMAETLSKGWASSAVLSSTLERYYWDDLYYEGENVLDALGDEQKKTLEKMLDDGDISIDDWKGLNNLKEISDEAKQSILDLAVTSKKLTETTDKDGHKLYEFTNAAGEKIQFSMEQFEESLSSGWFDKDFGKKVLTASNGVNELAKSSYEAAQKCKTFSDVLDAWRDQISTGWMNSFKLIFGELSESMEFFSAVCDKVGTAIGELIDIRNGILEAWAGSGGRQDLFSIIVGDFEEGAEGNAFGLLDIFTSIKDLLRDGMIDMFSIFMSPDDATKSKADPRYFATWMGRKLAEITKKVKDFVGSIRGFFNEGITVNGQVTTRLDMIRNVVKGVAGAIAMAYNIGKNVFGFFRTIVSQLMPSLDAVMGFFSKLGITIFDSSKKANKSNALQKFFSDLAEILKPITNIINIAVASVADLFSAIFGLDKKEGDQGSKVFTNIGEGIKKLADIISKYLTPVIGFFADFIRIIRDIVSNKFSAESLAQFGTKFKAIFDKLIASMPEPIKNFVATIEKFFSGEKFQKIRDKVQKAFEGIVNAIPKDLKGKLGKVIEKIRKFFEDMKSGVANAIKKLFQKGDPQITEATEAVSNSIIPSDLTDILNRGAAGDSKSIFQRALDWIKNKFDAVKQFFANVKEYLSGGANSFSSKVGEFVNWLKAINWNDILGIAIVAGAAATVAYLSITFIQSFKKLANGIQTIGECLKNGVKFKASLIQIGEDDDDEEEEAAETMGDKILKIALAVAIISAAIMMIGRMQWQDAIKGLAVVGVVIAAIIACVLIFKSAFNGNEKKGKEGLGEEGAEAMANVFKAIAISIAIIIASLLVLTKLKDPMDFVKMAGGLIVILGALTAVMLVMSKNKISMNKSGMLELVALAFSIKILISALLPLAIMRWDMMAKMAAGLVVLLGSLVLVMAAVNKMKMGVKGSGMAELIAMALSIAILVAVLIPLSFLPTKQLIKMAFILAVALGEIIAAMAIVDTMSRGVKGSGMAELIAMAISIAILMAVLIPISFMPVKKLLKMGAVLAVVLAMLVGVMAIVGKNKISVKGTGMAQLIAFALAVAILVVAMLPISLMDTEQVIKMLATILILMAGLTAVMFAVSSGTMSIKNGIGGLLVLIGVVGVIVAFTVALQQIKDIPTDKITGFAAGVSLLITSIGAISVLLGSIGIANALIGIVAFFVLLAGTMAIAAALIPWMIESILPAVEKVGPVFTSLGTAFEEFGNALSGVDADKLKASADVLTAIAGLQAVLTAENIALEVFNKLGLNVEPANLTSFGDNFAALGPAVAKFSDSVKDSDFSNTDKAVEALIAFATLNNTLLGQAFMQAIGNWAFGKDNFPEPETIYELGEDMEKVAPALKSFVEAVKGQTFDNVEPAINTLKTFASINDVLIGQSFLHAIGNWAFGKDNFPEPKTISDLGADMGAVAPSLSQFTKATQGLSFDNVGPAVDALKTFATINDVLLGQSFKQAIGNWLFGEGNFPKPETITELGDEMASVAPALSTFALSVEGLTFTNVGPAVEALKAFASINDVLLNTSIKQGIANWVLGDNMPKPETITELGDEMASITPALNTFALSVEGLTFTNVGPAVEALKAFASINDVLLNTSIKQGIANWVLGDSMPEPETITELGEDMTTIAPALKAFASGMAADDFSNVDPAVNAIKAFASINDVLLNTSIKQGIAKWVLGDNLPDPQTITNLGMDMLMIAPALKAFASGMAADDFSNVDPAVNALKAFASINDVLIGTSLKEGLGNWLFGKENMPDPQTITGLGLDMVAIAPALNGFAKNLANTTFDNVEPAVNALKTFASINEILLGDAFMQGLGNWLFGANNMPEPTDIEDLAKDMNAIAPELAEFAGAVPSTLSFEGVNNGLEALRVFAEIQKVLNEGSVKEGFANLILKPFGGEVKEKELKDFGSQLAPLGEGMAKYVKAVTQIKDEEGNLLEIDATKFDASIKAIQALTELQKALPDVGGLISWFKGNQQDLEDFGSKLGTFGTDLAGFFLNTFYGGYATEGRANAIGEVLKQLSQITSWLHIYGIDSLTFNISSLGNSIRDLFVKIGDVPSGTTDALTALYGIFQASGALFTSKKVVEGITELTKAFTELETINALNEAGENLAKGIGDGIGRGTDYVTGKIKDLVQAAIEKYNEETDTNSPSRVFMDLAEYIPAGIGEGITNGAPEALEPITKLIDLITGTFTDAAKSNAFQSFVNMIDQLLYSAGDGADTEKLGVTLRLLEAIEQVMANTDGLNPTITPVLDMTNVQNGMDLFRQNLYNNPFGMPVGGPTYGPNQNGSSGIIPPENAMAILAEARELYTGQVNRQMPATSTYATSAELADFRKSLEAMNNTLNDFGEKFDNLAIVLNTGALVGGIAPEMERELGRRGFYSSRRN